MQLLDQTAFLLATSDDGGEWVQQYSASEVADLFSEAEQVQLAAGRAVVKHSRLGGVRYVDMIGAARMVAE